MPSSVLCFGIAHLFFIETALIPPDERFLLFPDYEVHQRFPFNVKDDTGLPFSQVR